MTSRARILFCLSLLASLAAGCVMADEGLEEEAGLEEIEGYTTAGGAIVRPRTVPPGSESLSFTVRSDDGGTVKSGEVSACKLVGGGGSECTTWFCDNLKMGEDHGCVVQCGYSCQGTPDECLDVGC